MPELKKLMKNNATISALSNPFPAGGGRVDFEHRVQASFLIALLVGGFSSLLNLAITSMLFRVKRMEYDTDDIVLLSSFDVYSANLGRFAKCIVV